MTAGDRDQSISDLDTLHQGWVLKKKRKKMQGYAKRYLVLTREGILTYAMAPEKSTRDSISIPHASVTTSKRHGTIHVDSGSSTFHIKMLESADFDTWVQSLKSFIPEEDLGGGLEKKRIYTSSDGKNFDPIDLSHLFANSKTMKTLIDSISAKCQQIQKEQASILSTLMSGGGSGDSTASQLAVLVDQLRAEHGNLQHALDTKVPNIELSPEYAKRSQGMAKSRTSISSFQTLATDEATFYDADASGAGLFDEESGSSSRDESDSAGEESEDEDSDEDTAKGSGGDQVEHRKELPAPVSGDEVSLFSMLKKNVGKDLSTVSFPVSFNCPLSLLQASAEEFEYAPDLLERAAKSEKDWVKRIGLVAAFAVSGYASTKLRASRKPFNPLLGETFELVRTDKQMRFIAEKVVHQPPIVALYAEGKGWKAMGWSSVKNKFWGKSLELIPDGDLRVEFSDGDVFSFKKPSSFMRNLLAGNKYLEHVGELTVTNEESGQRAVIEFKEGNMWGSSSSRNQVSGTIYDEKGKKVTTLKGKWSDNLALVKDDDNYQQLWEANEMPDNAEKYYGFTYFAMSLNEMTKDIEGKLPPTDSRLRPDQRAFEEGDVDKAEELKAKLEGQQRERRQNGKAPKPRWFHEEKGETPSWKYGADDGTTYFKARAKVYGDDEKMQKEEGKEPQSGKSGSAEAWEKTPQIFDMN